MGSRCLPAFALWVALRPALLAADPDLRVAIPPELVGPAPIPLLVDVAASALPAGGTRYGFRLLSVEHAPTGAGEAGFAQFEPGPAGARRGRLWLLVPGQPAGVRRYCLLPEEGSPGLTVTADTARGFYDVADAGRPVLRYNHGAVPPPPGIATNFTRGDYLMPVFGPWGELLTDDYPPDHPHHRGIGWSWPVTRWGDEVRDIWAVAGVWARPEAIRRAEGGHALAVVEALNVWKWGDTNPIVREEVTVRTFRADRGHRIIDIELRLTALADGVAIGGRPHGGYGGFGLRAQPAEARNITRLTDPPETRPRRSWLDYSGRFKGATAASGIAILESPDNPLYPSELKEYPDLNYVMPAFPGEREVPLRRDAPLVLRHRLWLHPGHPDTSALAAVWRAYADPPTAVLLPKD
jgi:hypothetical protein